MVFPTTPVTACFLVFFLISLGEAGKKQKNDQIIIHVPYKIHHHHYPPQVKYVKIPEIKTDLLLPEVTFKPEEIFKPLETFKPEQTFKPLETFKPEEAFQPLEAFKPEEDFKPEKIQPTINFNETLEPLKKEQKQKKLKKILKRKPKTTQIPPSPPSFPLETFLGLDKILGIQDNKPKPAPLPVRLPTKPTDYAFSDGTDLNVRQPKQLQITSYAFTTLKHSKPQPVVESSKKLTKAKSERSLEENPDYEHVGYFLIPKNHRSEYNRNY